MSTSTTPTTPAWLSLRFQFETWSHQGGRRQFQDNLRVGSVALCRRVNVSPCMATMFFLQGSYGNDTNIRADSDVDCRRHANRCVSP